MAEELEGEEFVVDKILDKRVRNGKIEYYLSWKVVVLLEFFLNFIIERVLDPKKTPGSLKRISIVLI